MIRAVISLIGTSLLGITSGSAQGVDFRPEIGIEVRVFADDPQFDGQVDTAQGSLILSGDGRWTSADRDTRLLFEPFIRVDTNDDHRTYVDIREASLSHEINRDWDILIGISQVFWGVAESRNVVDVINQFDTVEDYDEGEKLGQPMARLTRRGDFGTIEAYYLPYFRKRLFPGEDGRLRTNPLTDGDDARFERGGDEWAGDVALRYTNRFNGFDLGFHGFYGTSRNPRLDFNPETAELEPFYPELTQGGVDLQWTADAWLLKGEAVLGEMLGQTYTSAVGGVEYTFFDIQGQGWDLGLIAEYLYDDRDQVQLPATPFESDVFAGARITLNDIQDTEILAGAIIDEQTGAILASVEFQRRLGNSMLLELEGRLFTAKDDPFVAAFDADDHLLVRLTRYF